MKRRTWMVTAAAIGTLTAGAVRSDAEAKRAWVGHVCDLRSAGCLARKASTTMPPGSTASDTGHPDRQGVPGWLVASLVVAIAHSAMIALLRSVRKKSGHFSHNVR